MPETKKLGGCCKHPPCSWAPQAGDSRKAVATDSVVLSRFHFKPWTGVLAMKKSNICSDNQDALLQHQAAIVEGILDSKARYRKIVQAGIGKWVSDFQKGNIQVNSVEDLKKLIELDLDLQRDEL